MSQCNRTVTLPRSEVNLVQFCLIRWCNGASVGCFWVGGRDESKSTRSSEEGCNETAHTYLSTCHKGVTR
jgi:hypothetical protein